MSGLKRVGRVLLVLVILYIFLVSIGGMGSAFKILGKDAATTLVSLSDSPVLALFIGILATSIVQSSSATTALIVGLTAGGLLSVAAAIPMIMGANIGTSITNTIVSLGHIKSKKEFRKAFEVATVHDFFNLLVVLVFLPLEIMFGIIQSSAIFLTNFFLGGEAIMFSSPLKAITKPAVEALTSALGGSAVLLLIISVILLFASLHYFVVSMRPLAESEFKHKLHHHIFKHGYRALGFGLFLTVLVQSSSVTTSLIVPLAGVGIITLHQAFPYILGANIGTTITALLAATVAGEAAGVTVALAHLIFNVGGSIMMYPLRSIPIKMSETLAHYSFKSRAYPIAYIGCVFFLLPGMIILIFH